MICSETKEDLILPSLPHVVVRLLEASMDDDVSMTHLSALISQDPALAAQILRFANSPLYSAGGHVSSISSAVIILGIRAVRSLAVTVSIYQSFAHMPCRKDFSMAMFWHHSLLVAVCAKYLAEKTGFEEPEDAFLAGMLHDIGQLIIMSRCLNEEGRSNMPATVQNVRTGRTIISAERQAAGEDHAVVGGHLLDEWRFDPLMADAVRYHHGSVEEIRDAFPLVKIVFLADRLAHCLVLSESTLSDNEVCEESRFLIRDFFDVPSDVLEELTGVYRDQLSETASLMGMDVEEPDVSEMLAETASSEDDESSRLRRGAFDHAMAMGAVGEMASAPDPDVLFERFIHALSIIFNPEAVLAVRFKGNDRLHGIAARGTSRSDRIHMVHVRIEEDSIWDSAFSLDQPLHYNDFFSHCQPSVSDRQIMSFMGGPFLIVPVNSRRKKRGAIVLAMKHARWNVLRQYMDILMLLAGQFFAIYEGYHFRNLWDRERKLNAAMLRTMPVPVVLIDEPGHVVYGNAAASKALAGDRKSLEQGTDIWQYLGLKEGEVQDFLADALSGAIAEMATVKYRNAAGMHWFRVRGLKMAGMGRHHLMLIFEDVTARYLLDRERRERAEILEAELLKRTRELENAHKKLIQAERLTGIGRFARQVAHEVNNPLGIIKNFLKILQREISQGKGDSATVRAIDAEIDRIADTIGRLHQFARYGAPGFDEKLNEHGLVQAAIDVVRPLLSKTFAEEDIELTFEVEQDLPVVQMSEDSIRQVIINLIKNAGEATGPRGKIDVQVYEQVSGDTVDVVIEVRDNGPGVAPEIMDQLFEPFTTTKGQENSGLGLSVCYGLVKAAGGDIEVESVQGKGTVFRIVLPAKGVSGTG